MKTKKPKKRGKNMKISRGNNDDLRIIRGGDGCSG